jgi:hypothetical protein
LVRVIIPAMSDVFISYVAEDQALALALADGLEAAGFTTWCYDRHTLPGLSYLLQTLRAIEECRAVLVLLSPNSSALSRSIGKSSAPMRLTRSSSRS